jgi:Zn-dependent protease
MISFIEIKDLIIVTFAIGYIFSGFVRLPGLITNYEKIKNSIYVAAPAVILHELMHKFVAISFGLEAIFKAYYPGLALGVILKLVNSPLLILAPGFVTIPSSTSTSISAIVAFAGPFTNLLLWIAAYFLLKMKNLSQKQVLFLALTKKINLILFIFNMIPFGPLDGAKVLNGIVSLF